MYATITVLAALIACAGAGAQGTDGAQACRSAANGKVLDFWVGEWTVREQGKNAVDGVDRVERILDGCVILEHWSGTAPGDVGESFFYLVPTIHRWKQVWATPRASMVGGLKEKELIAVSPDRSVRFQGNLSTPSGVIVLDRTTLTPLSDGTVRQLIETSRDGGSTWQVGYDAIYTRKR